MGATTLQQAGLQLLLAQEYSCGLTCNLHRHRNMYQDHSTMEGKVARTDLFPA